MAEKVWAIQLEQGSECALFVTYTFNYDDLKETIKEIKKTLKIVEENDLVSAEFDAGFFEQYDGIDMGELHEVIDYDPNYVLTGHTLYIKVETDAVTFQDQNEFSRYLTLGELEEALKELSCNVQKLITED
jgi:hypothetical protein